LMAVGTAQAGGFLVGSLVEKFTLVHKMQSWAGACWPNQTVAHMIQANYCTKSPAQAVHCPGARYTRRLIATDFKPRPPENFRITRWHARKKRSDFERSRR
jgi:hypothetical protein